MGPKRVGSVLNLTILARQIFFTSDIGILTCDLVLALKIMTSRFLLMSSLESSIAPLSAPPKLVMLEPVKIPMLHFFLLNYFMIQKRLKMLLCGS